MHGNVTENSSLGFLASAFSTVYDQFVLFLIPRTIVPRVSFARDLANYFRDF